MKPSSYPEINHQSLNEICPLCSIASRDPHGFLCTLRYGSIRWSSHTTHLYYTVPWTPSVTQNHPRNPKPHLSFLAGYALCRAASCSLTHSFTLTHALSLSLASNLRAAPNLSLGPCTKLTFPRPAHHVLDGSRPRIVGPWSVILGPEIASRDAFT